MSTLTVWQARPHEAADWRYVTPDTAAIVSAARPTCVRLADAPVPTAIAFERGMTVRQLRALRPGVTPARLAAAERALRAERDKVSLFADRVAAEQSTPLQRVQRADAGVFQSLRAERLETARKWRQCRAILRTLPEDLRGELLFKWSASFGPKHAYRFLSFLHTSLRQRGLEPQKDPHAQA